MEKNNPDKLWSLEAEAAVLGSMIIDPSSIDNVLSILLAEDAFFEDAHQIIYAALLRLCATNIPIDAIALRTELKNANQLEQIGGVEYLAKIMESVPSSANVAYYAGVVRDRQRYRGLIRDVEQIGGLVDEPIPVDEQIQKIQDIAFAMETGKSETSVFTLAEEAVKVADAMPEHKEIIPTGFRNIDKIIQGVSPGELVILAGRPSMGKSALALDIALNMMEAGKSVVFFTLEMLHKGLIERALCNRAKINMVEVKSGYAIPERLEKLHTQAVEMQTLDLVLHESASTPEQQIAFIRTRKKTNKVDVVFIDYLQLMSTGRKVESRQQEIATISRKLKLAAAQEQVPIIVLSQLNRQVEARQTHRPRLSDLRESGAIEQDADVVMLLHRKDYYCRDEDSPEGDKVAEIIVAKKRQAPTGIAYLIFLPEYVKFGDAAPPDVKGE